MKISAIITAGGSSQRFGKTNKLLEKIHSKEVIKYTVEAFLKVSKIDEIIIPAHQTSIDILQELFKGVQKVRIILGGASRQESVYNGLKAAFGSDYVLIHDGARPMIRPEIIEKCISEVIEKKALTVATKTIDTIKQVDENLKIIKTIDRSSLYNTQTPQAFDYKLILGVHEKLQGQNFTDDAGMIENLGYDVYILECDSSNMKITTQNDLKIAEAYLE